MTLEVDNGNRPRWTPPCPEPPAARPGPQPGVRRPPGARPAAAPTPRAPLDQVVCRARQELPPRPIQGPITRMLGRQAALLEFGHLLHFGGESAHIAHARVPGPSVGAATATGLGAAVMLFVKINIELARANNDGLHLARCGAFGQGFARVAAAAVAQGGLLAVQRNPRSWPTPAALPNRNDADYQRGVRAGVETFESMSRADLARAAADLVRVTPNVTGDPRSEANLSLRLSVLLGGLGGNARLRF